MFVLLADILLTITSQIISISSDGQPAATATVFFFVVIIVFFFGILVGINFIFVCCKHSDILPLKLALLTAQTFGALLYFYGDNISSIVTQYGEELGCGTRCRENNRIAGAISTGVALMFYQLFPPCLQRIAVVAVESNVKKWYSASHMIVTIVKIDALYTVVATMAQSGEFCSRDDLAVSVSFLILSFVIGVSFMLAYCLLSTKQLRDDEETHKYSFLVPLALITLSISFPVYMVTDNEQPLDCAFGCDSFATNQTLNDVSCNEVSNSAFRLGLSIVVFVTISTLTLMLFCCRTHTKAEAETEKAV